MPEASLVKDTSYCVGPFTIQEITLDNVEVGPAAENLTTVTAENLGLFTDMDKTDSSSIIHCSGKVYWFHAFALLGSTVLQLAIRADRDGNIVHYYLGDRVVDTVLPGLMEYLNYVNGKLFQLLVDKKTGAYTFKDFKYGFDNDLLCFQEGKF